MADEKHTTSLQQISFHNDTLYVIIDERTGKEYVLPKPMSDMFGLDWSGQFKKLKRNQIFSKGIDFHAIPSAGGMQQTVLLERRLVHAWLLSIDVNRVAPEYREKLLRYQEECASVLDAYFTQGAAINPRMHADPQMSSIEHQHAEVSLIERTLDLLERLGQLTARDRLMFADQVRNVGMTGQRLLPAGQGTTTHGFSVAERVAQLGYQLTRKQAATHLPKLGKRIAYEWRTREQLDPHTESRYVDGATRPVAWYPDTASSWADVIIQTYFAQFPDCPRRTDVTREL
jgi:hypothetical protein